MDAKWYTLPYHINISHKMRGLFPEEFQPLFRGRRFALLDRSAGYTTPETPFGMPIYYCGHVVEGTSGDGDVPACVTWCAAQEYLDMHGMHRLTGHSAEFTVLCKLMWESVAVRACPVQVHMTIDQWLDIYFKDGAQLHHTQRGDYDE